MTMNNQMKAVFLGFFCAITLLACPPPTQTVSQQAHEEKDETAQVEPAVVKTQQEKQPVVKKPFSGFIIKTVKQPQPTTENTDDTISQTIQNGKVDVEKSENNSEKEEEETLPYIEPPSFNNLVSKQSVTINPISVIPTSEAIQNVLGLSKSKSKQKERIMKKEIILYNSGEIKIVNTNLAITIFNKQGTIVAEKKLNPREEALTSQNGNFIIIKKNISADFGTEKYGPELHLKLYDDKLNIISEFKRIFYEDRIYISPNGNVITTPNYINKNSTMQVYSQNGKLINEISINSIPNMREYYVNIAISQDGKYFAVNNSNRYLILYTINGKELWRKKLSSLNINWNEVHISYSGKAIIAFDSDTISVYDLQGNLLIKENYRKKNQRALLRGFAFSEDEQYLIFKTTKSICLYNLEQKKKQWHYSIGKKIYGSHKLGQYNDIDTNGQYTVFHYPPDQINVLDRNGELLYKEKLSNLVKNTKVFFLKFIDSQQFTITTGDLKHTFKIKN